MNFITFKQAVAKQFEKMQKHPLYRVAIDKDLMYSTYQNAFPSGTNEIFRERPVHDCSCCRQFIRNVGDVVAFLDGKWVSIWDVTMQGEETYSAVARKMSALVLALPVTDKFLHYEPHAGTDKTFEELLDKSSKQWDHFHVSIDRKYVRRNADIATELSVQRSAHDVFHRALSEIKMTSIDTVLDLIAQGSLYRGEEHTFAVTEFQKHKKVFDSLGANEQSAFAWIKIENLTGSVTNIRNSSIGKLIVDLDDDKDLEQAVKSFEAMVAPQNYKRPTALITPAMIEKAKKELEALGLTSALDRRFANIHDITINNILFANRDAKQVMTGTVWDGLIATAPVSTKNFDKVEDVHIEKFLADILPKADSIEIMMENKHQNNLVSLIAPNDPTAGNMFKWDNKFSWSYNGEFADSIKERVKNAGGSVVGDLCCRLAWSNYDDLDFHMLEPDGNEISFHNKGISRCGGQLDVDMNAGAGRTRTPVENIFYSHTAQMKEGVYQLVVHNYCQRESKDVGFTVELDMLGVVHTFNYDKPVKDQQVISIANIKYSKDKGFEIIKSLESTQTKKEIWGVQTNDFQKVNVVMMSPNFWDEKAVGNKHYFFMLDKCKNDGTARGFFNEFLKEELNVHRKVFEVVGSKTKVQEAAEQLSGLGFSSTQENSILCRVKGSFNRTIRISF